MDKMIKNEMDYSLALQYLKQLLAKQLLTREEFDEMKWKCLVKYEPYIGQLSAEIDG